MFVITEEGVIVVEPISTQHSKGLFTAIRNVTEKPVRYLLHSHNHWDHSKGGQSTP
jgi:glyoxylase-like metal-dependent hydrolase (beta-lactamase superfamily II)